MLALATLLIAASACGGGGTAGRDEGQTREIHPSPLIRDGSERRLILIGLDAADERLIRAGIEAGRLPRFARMVREGVSGPLRTYRPMLSPILWTTMATGLAPDRHGVLDFVEVDSAGRTIPVTSASRRGAAFWEVLGANGIPCGVVGWLATYPARSVSGFLVTDRFTAHPFEDAWNGEPADLPGRTFPAELAVSLRDTIARPEAIGDEDLHAAFGLAPGNWEGAAEERRELKRIEAVARTYTAAALRLDGEHSPALLAVYFEAIDRLMHRFGGYAPPLLPGVTAEKAARYGRIVEKYYAAMDERLGRFLDRAGPRTTVLVVSDHGFKIGGERPRHPALRSDLFAAEWHRSPGVILAWGNGVRRGARIQGADIYDIAPTILGFFGLPSSESMRGDPLVGIFEPGFLPPIPPRVPDDSLIAREESVDRLAGASPDSEAAGPGRAARAPDDEARAREEEAILENLRALGYVGGGGGEAALRASANLATFYLEEGQFERAAAIYRKVLERDPEDLTALYNLGSAYRGLGAHAKASECFERILAKRPDYMEARLVLSDCYVSLGRPDRALALLKQREADGREDAGYQNHLGTVMASAGRLEEAVSALTRAIELRPGEASPYLNLARIEVALGRKAAAAETLRRAGIAAPDDPRVSDRLRELGIESPQFRDLEIP